MKRILIGTPYRDDFTKAYFNGMVAVLTSSNLAQKYVFTPAVNTSPYVQACRNEMANKAVAEGHDEILFVDADVGWGPEAVERILSHDVDIVGGDYCKRISGPPQWVSRAMPGSTPREDGLQRATCLPGGFLRIKTHVFKRMYELLPQRRYRHEGKPAACEFFPVALTEKNGWRHPAEVRLDMVRDALDDGPDVWTSLKRALEADLPEFPEIVGEDVSFCRLAEACGFDVWCDLGLALRHYGVIGFPATETSFDFPSETTKQQPT